MHTCASTQQLTETQTPKTSYVVIKLGTLARDRRTRMFSLKCDSQGGRPSGCPSLRKCQQSLSLGSWFEHLNKVPVGEHIHSQGWTAWLFLCSRSVITPPALLLGYAHCLPGFPSQSNSELLEPKISARGKPVRPAGRSLQLPQAAFPYTCSSSRAGSGQCKRAEMAWMMQEFPWLCQPSPQQLPDDCISCLIPTLTPGISKKLWLQRSFPKPDVGKMFPICLRGN